MTPPHALVTGAASGIGAAIAADLGAHGYRITGLDLRRDALSTVLERIGNEHGVPALGIEVDLADVEAAQAAVDRAWSWAPIDALVNAAGIYPVTPFLTLQPAEWDRVQNVNVRAPLFLLQRLAQLAIPAGRTPAVVNITSGAARAARPGTAPYSTSKAALEAVTRAGAVELGAVGIRVNSIAPGFVPVASEVNPVTDEYAAAVNRSLLPTPATPEGVASAVRLLLGSDAARITGVVVPVDGGAGAGTHALPQHWAGPTEWQLGGPPGPSPDAEIRVVVPIGAGQ